MDRAGMSPVHRHVRSGSAGGAFRRQQNTAARAAAQRLARVMAHQPAGDGASSDEDDHEDDDPFELSVPLPDISTPRRSARSPSPAIGRYLAEQAPISRPNSAGRLSTVAKPVTLIPPIRSTPRPIITLSGSESPVFSRRDKRMSVDLGNLNMRERARSHSSSPFQDEINVRQQENENILDKLQFAEERYVEAEEKSKQLEKQVTAQSASNEARLVYRKEAVPQQREDALRVPAKATDTKNEEITALRSEAMAARKEATFIAEHLHIAESELRSLRTVAQRMLLSQEEMEEVVLKRCWLARYWKLCVQYGYSRRHSIYINEGIHADIAETKHEYWSSLAPLSLEVMLSAGQKARDECSSDKADVEERNKGSFDMNDLSGEGNIESMLLVEKGIRELLSLKVEEAVLLAMAQHRRATIRSFSERAINKPHILGPLLPIEGQNPVEALELSKEESEDVLFKQAWLVYLWRRVKNHGLEEDIADERLKFLIEQSNHSPTSHDVIEVERALLEVRKLGLESQLWEASRRQIDLDVSLHGGQTGSEL